MTNAHEFTARLQDLLGRERVAQAEFLLALSDFDKRRLWLDLGYASLFDFLHRELGLSKASTFLRARAALLIQKFPRVLEALRDGRLCLSTMGELSKVLDDENVEEVLPRFFLLSKREAKAVAAAIRPDEAPPRRDVVTIVRVPAEAPRLELSAPQAPFGPPPEASFSLGVVRPGEQASSVSPPQAASAPPPPSAPPSTIEPLTADLIRVHLTAHKRFAEKYEKAKDLLSHARPGAGMAEILEAGLDALIERQEKRKGVVKKPLPNPRPSSDPDHVPAHVQRAVRERDGGRCQFPVASGGVCGSRVRVELHHRRSRHRGGPPTVENLTTLCGFHHDLETRKEFGDAYVERVVHEKRGRAPSPRPAEVLSP